MNKKLIIGILIGLILLIIGSVVLTEINKADTEVPNISLHLQNANIEYNNAVTYLNVKNYAKAIEHINNSYNEYTQALTSTEKAHEKAKKFNNSIQTEYFNYTLTEINYKLNATVELYDGLLTVNNSPSRALQYFSKSHEYMVNATKYSDKRKVLEEQYPDNFSK